MSLLTRPVSVNLAATPILCWRWYIDDTIAKADMTKKSGDDYAARVYLGFDIADSALPGSVRLKLKWHEPYTGRTYPTQPSSMCGTISIPWGLPGGAATPIDRS